MTAPLAAVAALMSMPQAADRLELSRGGGLAGQAVRYWAAEDTVLDPKDPEEAPGGSPFLSAGPGRTLLIRFGDLRRAIPPGQRIRSASIRFTVTAGGPASLARAAEMLVPWGEGPAQVLGYGAAANLQNRNWGATWRARRAGEPAIPWAQAGAQGASDARPLADVRAMAPDPDHLRITGLGPALQRQYDRPFANFGLAFQFDAGIEFASAQARNGRPVLELELEPAPTPADAADLAVLHISASPEYPRLGRAPETHRAVQDGVEVAVPGGAPAPNEKHAPANDEDITYTARVKNLGNRPATGFLVRWSQRERAGSAVELGRTLEPGAETTVTLKAPYRANPGDPRLHPIGLTLEPLAGGDRDPSNNGLTIHEGALSVGFRLAPGVAERIAGQKPLGARSVDEWAQTLANLWNETIFPQSQFSFAPNGALVRLRVQQVETATTEAPEFGVFEGPNLDLAITIGPEAKLDDPAAMRRLLKLMGREMGLADLGAMNLQPGGKPITLGNQTISQFAPDLFPGLMGGGDTRYDGFVPNLLIPPYEPIVSPLFDVLYMPGTDLLAATDVASLNAAAGLRRGFAPVGLFALPSTVLLKVTNSAGLPVAGASIEVFPMAAGGFPLAEPIARLQTGDAGTAMLPNRPSQIPSDFRTLLAKPPAMNPFGRIDPLGANGVLALRITGGGGVSIKFVKAWQFADAFRRNPSPVVVFDVRVDAGGGVERGQNLAQNRIVADAANSLPAVLAALVDEKVAEPVAIPGGKDAWVEVDLGRDRVFGEVRLFAKGPFWERFDVVAFATGQTVAEAKVLAREASWSYAFANRSDAESEAGVRSVAYRTSGLRARYIRLIRTQDGPPGGLTEIKVFALKAP